MANLTAQLDEALKRHNARLGSHRKSLERMTDEFLKEAYRINSHLRDLRSYLQRIRQPYLSTAPPPHRTGILATGADRPGANASRAHFTDVQRDEIDGECKRTLRDLNAGIRQLEEVERIRRETEAQLADKRRGRNGFLGRWAAGGAGMVKSPEDELEEARESGLKAHRESVVWYLRRQLEVAAEAQREMMEIRLKRELEKSKSVLYKTRGTTLSPTTNKSPGFAAGPEGAEKALPEKTRTGSTVPELTPEQMQLFEEENNDMLRHYEDTLDQVRTAEKSMIEISELQTTLAQNLEMQSTRIDQLMEDTDNTQLNVTSGNKELKKASERWRPAQFVFYATCGLSFFLVAWDFLI